MTSSVTISWTKDMTTGIDAIDNQHKRIVDYINQLGHAIRHKDRAEVGVVLDELVDYTISHFSFEESLQEEVAYPYAKPHKAVHDAFIKRVATYQERHNAGADIAQQLHTMLSTWLVHHIKRDDMAYVARAKAQITTVVQNKAEGNWLSRALGNFFK